MFACVWMSVHAVGRYRIWDRDWSPDFLFHFRRLTDNILPAHKCAKQIFTDTPTRNV